MERAYCLVEIFNCINPDTGVLDFGLYHEGSKYNSPSAPYHFWHTLIKGASSQEASGFATICHLWMEGIEQARVY
jgi:hypothetical protein